MKVSQIDARWLFAWTLALNLSWVSTIPQACAQITTQPSTTQPPTQPTTLQVPPLASRESLTVLHADSNRGDDATGDGSSEKPFKTITRTLTAVATGGTVQLAAGEYSEATGETFPLQLNGVQLLGDTATRGVGIKIIGGGKHVSPTFATQIVTVLIGKQVILRGVTITNPIDRGYGLWIEGVSPVVARNSFVANESDGIFITGKSAARISDNYFTKNISDGLTAADISTPMIENNVFEQTGFGINITGRSQARLVGNIIRNNVDGLIIEARSSVLMRNNVIENNRRSGVAVLGAATADLGTENEAGGNTFARNGRADVNNVTNPAVELIALGNRWTQPHFSGRVVAEPEVIALAAQYTNYRVLVTGKNATRVSTLKEELTLQPVSQSYQGKPAVQVGVYSKEQAELLVKQLNSKGFKALSLPLPTGAPQSPTLAPGPAKPAEKPAAQTVVPASKVFTKPTAKTALPPVAQAPVPPGPNVQTATKKPQTTVPSTATRVHVSGPTVYKVLVTDAIDPERLKEVVAQVVQRTHAGRPALQVGVFSSQENASRLVEELSSKGFRAIVVNADLQG